MADIAKIIESSYKFWNLKFNDFSMSKTDKMMKAMCNSLLMHLAANQPGWLLTRNYFPLILLTLYDTSDNLILKCVSLHSFLAFA